MKKKMRILALALTLAIALIGAGYAAWGTQITDSTTLKTGSWCVILENDAKGDSLVAGDKVYNFKNVNGTITDIADPLNGQDGYGKYDVEDSSSLSGGALKNGSTYVYTIEPTISNDAKTVSFKFLNLHPGTSVMTKFEMRNKGSIPAKIASVEVSYTDSIVAQSLKVRPSFWINGAQENEQPISVAECTLAELQSKLNTALAGKVLHPNEVIKTWAPHRDGSSDELENTFNYYLPGSALSGNVGQDTLVPISIKFNFVQYNQNN